MEIKKTIYYKLDEDDMMSLYECFSNYCFMNDLEENWETFREYYNDMCVEENWNPIEEIYENEDGEDTIYLLFKELMSNYNKEFVEIEKLEQRKREIECEYKKIENKIEEIKHKYDIY